MTNHHLLCLHGSEQNAEIFRTKIGRLPHKAQKERIQITYLNAPHALALRPGDEVPLRTWYMRRDRDGTIRKDTIEESLSLLEKTWRDGTFDGILGFSQGGAMAAVMASMPQRFPNLKSIIVVGAPSNLCDEPDNFMVSEGIPNELKSLHVMGVADKAVHMDSSMKLSSYFRAPIILEHAKGHLVPSKAIVLDFFVNFCLHCYDTSGKSALNPLAIQEDSDLTIHLPASSSSSITSTSSPSSSSSQKDCQSRLNYACSSEEYANAQSEELEALLAIYPESIIDITPPYPTSSYPLHQGSDCLAFTIKVPVTTMDDLNDLQQKIANNLSIRFQCTGKYPDESPQLDINTGNLSISDFTSTMRGSLTDNMRHCVSSNVGSVCAFPIVQMLVDWLQEEPEKFNGPLDKTVHIIDESNSYPGAISIFDTDLFEVTDDLIERVTGEACAAASEVSGLNRRISSRLSSLSSSGGVWNYTVGLIGKPSAGKSTFFNAVTRAALDRNGRKLAEVGSHPFTTIEPNFGPGFYGSLTGNEEGIGNEGSENGSFYGRDHRGRRMLPIVVKDVAGLVPGAYSGLGKGNKFLADICDANVLIHVVDATGTRDASGNVVAVSDNRDSSEGSSPVTDAKWVRKELHLWIYNNFIVKFHTVLRKYRIGGVNDSLDRIVSLFSGYHATRMYVEEALDRSKLDVDKVESWNALDIHRLVAHFLSVRFPICLALNKVDMIKAGEQERVISICEAEASARGEVAVPVSARAEIWSQIKEATGDVPVQLEKDFMKEKERNDMILNEVIERWGSTGVADCISAAVTKLCPPVLCYPCIDLETKASISQSSSSTTSRRLRDCIQLKYGSTVYDVYEALKRGAVPTAQLSGDFVRAEATSLHEGPRKQISRDAVICESNCVIKIQTNRKVVWQNLPHHNQSKSSASSQSRPEDAEHLD